VDTCDDAVDRLVFHRAAKKIKHACEWATLRDSL
jgi:hypothetical protein